MAAICHEIGISIRPNGHHRHGAYLINASPMVGLTQDEKGLLAQVVRAQRKSFPDHDSARLAGFSKTDRERVMKLALLLRLAIAVNKERRGSVQHIHCTIGEAGAAFALTGEGDLELESWSIQKLTALFQQVLHTPIREISITR